MAKTNFNDDSWLTPTFMDTFFGTDAVTGHTHDQLDADGSAPKILLTTMVADYIEGSFNVTCPIPYANAPTTVTMKYVRVGNIVTVSLPNGLFCHSTANDEMQIEPTSGTWDPNVVPAYAQFLGGIGLSTETVAGYWKTGAVSIPADNTSNWVFWIPDASSILQTTGFGFNQSPPKGLHVQSWTYQIT